MAIQKDILILANSIRSGGKRCIAGREVLYQNNITSLGNWIRPITDQDDGLILNDIRFRDYAEPRVGDVVRINFEEYANSQSQPENWVISGAQWELLDHWVFTVTLSEMLKEAPEDLWHSPLSHRTDCITPELFGLKRYTHSICIIKPTNLKLTIWTEFNQFSCNYKKKRIAMFSYNDIKYTMQITDPTMHHRYFEPFPNFGAPPKKIKTCNDCLLCISLTNAFTEGDGKRYKVVASVIEKVTK